MYDIVLTFVEAFRADELDSIISEIRRYVPVILVDEDEKFNFWDVLKNLRVVMDNSYGFEFLEKAE